MTTAEITTSALLYMRCLEGGKGGGGKGGGKGGEGGALPLGSTIQFPNRCRGIVGHLTRICHENVQHKQCKVAFENRRRGPG